MKVLEIQQQQRGQLTQRIKDKSKELLNYEVTEIELRLMAYAQYTLVNEQRINPHLINEEDWKVLLKWLKNGFVLDGVSERLGRPLMSVDVKFRVTKEFWDAMVEILWLGYVDLNC